MQNVALLDHLHPLPSGGVVIEVGSRNATVAAFARACPVVLKSLCRGRLLDTFLLTGRHLFCCLEIMLDLLCLRSWFIRFVVRIVVSLSSVAHCARFFCEDVDLFPLAGTRLGSTLVLDSGARRRRNGLLSLCFVLYGSQDSWSLA